MTAKLEVVHAELDDLRQLAATATNRVPTADNLGRLSAQAVQASYTAAAQAVEGLKAPLIERAQKLEAALQGIDQAMKALEDWIQKINDTGHLIAAQIEEANALSSEMIKMSTEYVARVK
jgi:hypothetical protein